MTLADQMRFKIQKLDRAIEALGDLPAWQVSPVLGLLKADRAELRRSIASGRRSCGECGNPMTPAAVTGDFWCRSEDCTISAIRVLPTGEVLTYNPDGSRVADTMVECDCGHECGAAMVMSASMGTSCPDCYDTLSD